MSALATARAGARIDAARAEGRAALVGYWPLGYPSVAGSVAAVRAMVESGVDIVELGLPYTDPVIDGPAVADAVDAALRAGVRVRDVFGAIEEMAATGAPILVMSYWNPVLHYGVEAFAADLAAAGGAGLITPDLIPDEAGEWIAASDAHDLDRVFLVAPSSSVERLTLTARASRGFVYAASVMGITGARASVGERAEQLVADTRNAGAERVCVGLGVSNGDQAAQIAAYADGVIVGSALLRAFDGTDPADTDLGGVRALTAELAAGVRR